MKKLFFVILSVLAFGTAAAQITTSGMNGTVSADNGEHLTGATVIAIHTPSGSQYGAVTNRDGRYNLQGMRTGGPYTVTISYVGCQSVEFTDLTLQLGQYLTLDAALQPSTDLEAVVVVSRAADRFNTSKTGAARNFSAEAIAAMPTIDRSIHDMVRMTPQASVNKNGGMSFAGANNRYNSFQIDGAVSNDVFGLTPTGMAGGQTSTNVVSLDAIQEIQVVVAPFDVRQSGFTGGGINAITKSGNNTFSGSAYSYYNNQDFYGRRIDGERKPLPDQTTKVFGATIGGPIVKDKLFFFLSGEYSKDLNPSSYYPGSSDKFVTKEEAQTIIDRYKELTGMGDAFDRRNIVKQSVDVMARVDWNINRNNKLSVRYQLKDAFKDVLSSNATTYYFNNSSYKFINRTHAVVAELNSRLSDNVSNELRAGYTSVKDAREVPYQLPLVQIGKLGNGSVTGNIGTEYSSGANSLKQDIFTLTDNVSIYKGTHTITVGTHNEFYRTSNLFVQYNNGGYFYEDLQHFMDDVAWKYQWKHPDTAITGTNDWAAEFSAAQFGVYVQDEWNPTRRFSLTYGVRIDIPVLFSTPTANKTFNESVYADNGANTVGRMPSTKVLWSPRIGFRYYFDEAQRTLLRGGVGIFTGRVPFVWLSNAYGNTGMEMKGVTISAKYNPATGGYDYTDSQVPAFSTTPTSGREDNPDICTVDRDFKYPQVLRANLALEQIVGSGWKFTFEGIYSKTLNNVFFENLVAQDKGSVVYAVSESAATPANTTTYYTTDSRRPYYSAINLTNTNRGYTYNVSAMVEKHFRFGLDLMASYTFGHSYSVNDGTSSVASSNWKYNYAVRANDPRELSFSLFDVPHRVNVSLSYLSPRYAAGRLQTQVSLAYQGYSGQRYSLTMNENSDFNGDTQKGNSALYIPTDAEIDQMNWTANVIKSPSGEVVKTLYTADEAKANFREWCDTDPYAKEHRGQWSQRYGAVAPFEHHFDLHIAQNFFYDRKRARMVQLSLDVMNIGNLFNNDWGKYYAPAFNLQVLNVTAVKGNSTDPAVASTKYTPTYTWAGNKLVLHDLLSRWHMQIGVRVTF